MTLWHRKRRTTGLAGACRLLVVVAVSLIAQGAVYAAGFDLKIEVEGQKRVARVFEGREKEAESLPLLIAFHGYADNRTDFSRFVDLHKAWPEAVVVYPEGLKLPDREGKLRARGWQNRPGQHQDRDLAYLDTLLTELKQRYPIDQDRIYATGFSNGGQFVFLLMAQRPAVFAGFAPVGTTAAPAVLDSLAVPRPVMYIIGKKEIANRLEQAQETVEAISSNNHSTRKQHAWAEGYLSYEPAAGGEAFIFNLHKGAHVWPWSASKQIVRFFQEHSLNISQGSGSQ